MGDEGEQEAKGAGELKCRRPTGVTASRRAVAKHDAGHLSKLVRLLLRRLPEMLSCSLRASFAEQHLYMVDIFLTARDTPLDRSKTIGTRL